MTWSLLSWNVAGRIRRWPEQLAAVSQINPDVIALQEVTRRSSHMWRQALTERGWTWFVFSFDLAPAGFVASGPRRFGLVLASRFPIAVDDPNRFAVPWPERVLTAAIRLPHGPVEVSTTHVPPGASNGWIKIEHLEALRHRFASTPTCARLLCGDFNTPRRELPDGEVITFGQTEDGRVSRSRGGRWDAAERGIVTGLRDIGMPDAFRELHGYEPQAASWILKRHGRTFERRFDHVFADPQSPRAILHLSARPPTVRRQRPLRSDRRLRRTRLDRPHRWLWNAPTAPWQLSSTACSVPRGFVASMTSWPSRSWHCARPGSPARMTVLSP